MAKIRGPPLLHDCVWRCSLFLSALFFLNSVAAWIHLWKSRQQTKNKSPASAAQLHYRPLFSAIIYFFFYKRKPHKLGGRDCQCLLVLLHNSQRLQLAHNALVSAAVLRLPQINKNAEECDTRNSILTSEWRALNPQLWLLLLYNLGTKKSENTRKQELHLKRRLEQLQKESVICNLLGKIRPSNHKLIL